MEKLKAKIDKIIGFKLQFNAPAYYLNKLFKDILNWVDNKITKLENKINNINLSAENIKYNNNDYDTGNNVKSALDFIINNVDDCLNVQVDWNESDPTSDAYIKNKPNLNGYKTKQSVVNDPIASGSSDTFISTISQNANGEIVVTKKTITSNNSKIINKSLVCETKKINIGSSIKLYKYEILNNSTKFITNVLDIRNNNDVEYTNPDIFTCNKSIDSDAYLGIMYFTSSAGTYTFMLEITNTEINKSVEHLYHVMFDTPNNGTFIFCTTCNWEIKLVYDSNYNTRYLAYLLIPKEFKGTVKIKPIKYYQASGTTFGHFNGINEITYFNVYNKNTGNTHELLLTTDEITQKTDDNIIQPYGRYNVDFLGDIGDKNVGDLLSDALINSLQISDLKKMLYNLN